MRFIACADLHFTDKTPRNRKDNYLDAQLMKFSQILELAENEGVDLLVAGDVFDSTKVPYRITKLIMDLISQYPVQLYMVPGQHDLVYHVDGLDNTPLGILSTMDKVTILGVSKIAVTDGKSEVTIIGGGWNQEPKEKADILVTHRMVVHKNPLFPGQEDYSTGAQLMHKYRWASFIVSGDNHQPFSIYKKGDGRTLINCGSLMRKGKDQINHKPCVWMIDTETREHEQIELKVHPYRKVFDLNKIKREETQDSIKEQAQLSIEKFVNSLNMSENEKPRFENVLQRVVKEVQPNIEVVNIINQLMEEINE